MMRLIIIFFMFLSLKNFADVKAVLFDCDGTLVDSEHAHYLSWKQALLNLGSDLTLEEYYPYVGKPAEINARLLAEKIDKDCPELILKMKKDYYQEFRKEGLPPISSTVDFLKCLAEKKESLGIKIGLCSAAGKEEIASNLRHLQIAHLFDIILSGQEDLDLYSDPEGVNKPKPYIYLHAMKMLGVTSDYTVVIEDSLPGVTAARAAGCFTIAIPNEYTRGQDFCHANLRLESLKNIDIQSFLGMINNANKP